MFEELKDLNPLKAWSYCLTNKYLPVVLKCDGKEWNSKNNLPSKKDVTYPYNAKGIVMYEIEDYKLKNIEVINFDLYLIGDFLEMPIKSKGRIYPKIEE
jgi:hypothetical protein